MALKIALALPTNRLIKTKTAESLLRLIAYTPEEILPIVSTRGYNTSENRNWLATQACNNRCDYLFFADDDMIFPSDTLNRLLAHKKDIVGGIYKTKYEIQSEVVEYVDKGRLEGLSKCNAIGTGCLLIKTDVFRKLPQPWFKYEWNPNGSIKRSHDWIFCEDAINAGYEVWGDSTIDIKHIGIKEY